jgi:hypothetical protein
MKRKLVVGAGLGVLCIGVLVWVMSRSAPIVRGAVSQDDVGRIQQAVKREMWRKAFPDGFWPTIKQSPRSLWLLKTQQVLEIDALKKDAVQVKVRTRAGNYFYILIRSSEESPWQVTRQGNHRFIFLAKAYQGPDSPAQLLFKEHFFPRSFYDYRKGGADMPLTASEFSESLSNQARLRINLTASEFSESFSNRAKLKINR